MNSRAGKWDDQDQRIGTRFGGVFCDGPGVISYDMVLSSQTGLGSSGLDFAAAYADEQ